MTHSDAILEAKRLAAAGYGYEDIVVRVKHLLSLETAKQIVREAEYRRLAAAQNAKP